MKGKWKFLLIDSELEFHHILKHAFGEIELYSSYSIEGGRWLLSQTKSKFDLIFLDLNLHSGGSKFEELELICKKTFSPIIGISTYTDHNTKYEAIRRGASAFLSKGDFDLNSWLLVIKRVLAGDVNGHSKVFISYAREDSSFIKVLSDKLIENKINVRVNDVTRGNKIDPNLINGLEYSDYVVVALSPDALKSARVKHETTTAINLESENKLIGTIPLMVKPCEIPSDLESKRFISFVDNSKFNTCFKELMSTLEKE